MQIDAPLSTTLRQGKDDGTTIYTLAGPLTLRNMFDFQNELRGAPATKLTIFDLSEVPYMDSAGMGLIMNHYVHCQTRGGKLVVAGANARVLDLFNITKVNTVLPLANSVDEAEA
ncbi:MAG TPA: STAS domain-containing protein [Terracidiphilus sp.]|jgi:anti-sigma B factor antagonist|nr:STAS domain-containing protein [Terracidiphilus sp.]